MQRVKQLSILTNHEDDFLSTIYEQTQLKSESNYSYFGQSQDLLIMQQIKSFSCTVSKIDAEKTHQDLVCFSKRSTQ